MILESDLRQAFMAGAEACHRPAAHIPRERLRDFIQRQHEWVDYEAVDYGVRRPRTEGGGG